MPKITDILSKRKGTNIFQNSISQCNIILLNLTKQVKPCALSALHLETTVIMITYGNLQSPDIAQEIMEDLFRHLDETDVYIDDVGCFNNSWKSHLKSLEKVLTILQDNNFTINPLKCEWGVKETDWLGYWLTPTGLKPWRKKIDAIL